VLLQIWHPHRGTKHPDIDCLLLQGFRFIMAWDLKPVAWTSNSGS
ncbi:10395_t:CDS:1, partial [Cetraspora pellucida]